MSKQRVIRVGALVAALAIAVVSFGQPSARAAVNGTGYGGASVCTPGTIIFHGAYRVYDNAWLGRSAHRFCVSSTGVNITIDSNAAPDGGIVVAYPSIRYGRFFGDLDKPSGFPLPVPNLSGRRVILHVASTGHASGEWQSDVDSWFIPNKNWTQHGTAELVIINRSSSGQHGSGGYIIRIHGIRYRVATWITCQHLPRQTCDPQVQPWRLIKLDRVNHAARDTIYLGRTIRKLLARRLLHRGQWLGDVAYGTELWSGGKGLTDSLQVTS